MSETSPRTPAALDRGYLRSICGDDPEFEREVVREFLRLAEELVVEIIESARSGDTKRLFDAAHSFKGSSRSVGAGPLGDVCEELERDGREGRQPSPDELERLNSECARLRIEFQSLDSPDRGSAAA